MRLEQSLAEILPLDVAEDRVVWGLRKVDDPKILRISAALGVASALFLAVGAHLDWGGACVIGLMIATLVRSLFLAQHHLAQGGWQDWRQREANSAAIDLLSTGTGIALALFLLTGGGGVGPRFALEYAVVIGLLTGIVTRAILTWARWP